jgi:hypothetical protein
MFLMLGLGAKSATTQNALATPISTAISITILALFSIGVFRATASDPSVAGRGLSNIYRNTARVCVLLPVLFMPISWYLFFSFSPAQSVTVPFTITRKLTLGFVLTAISMFVSGLCVICVFICIRRLFHRARRIGLRRLATVEISLIVSGILIAIFACIVIAYVVPWFMSPAMQAAMTASTQPGATAPLPGGKVTNPAPNVTIVDYGNPQGVNIQISTPTTNVSVVSTQPTPTSTMPAVSVPSFPRPPGFFVVLAPLMFLFNCGGPLIFLGSLILGLIVLSKSRRLLTEVLAIKTV